ncbi:hypothetical protein PUNSTDRAFT_145382 [Punctularia strigosozonata HHB-11173 SS5]|uniref:uncharacterized protein n=1 Tax=Punctularia strigosozonata (strain HHB-11173) TaxID=741275 RepID=UPI00044174D2|nr:uncharacterized protein PUNSTDRAFT_145382 [Punctularia strigosozonata HHB-11173 SS5]EIN05991.1 hypothetical protein PUNSTDRAFT_145382 [Punctularia strigosozonata HHB-11173 SS5]
MSSSDAALKLEIARLTGAINRAKSGTSTPNPQQTHLANYINPSYKPVSQFARRPPSFTQSVPPAPGPSKKRDVVIGGIAFESSSRSLVRKDLSKPFKPSARPSKATHKFSRNAHGQMINDRRAYKPKSSMRHSGRNMTLNNKTGRSSTKRRKLLDKPCPRFTTTGSCSRGLTCAYQHDPDKIAICWPFLQGNCAKTAETCALSHDPIPQRTPLCVHFANAGRCTRTNCPFPHVRVGPKQGVCRDFAVLGYCDKGLDCEHQHVRECPDFADTGACMIKGCKLPHVIRANRNRKPVQAALAHRAIAGGAETASGAEPESESHESDGNTHSFLHPTVEDAQLGDEYISLTFNESEEEGEDSDEEHGDSEAESEGDAV